MNQQSQSQFPILQVKNLPYEYNSDELFEVFGQFGNIQEIRCGRNDLRGQAFIIYKNLKSCLIALDKLKGFSFNGRYLVCSIYSVDPKIISAIKEELSV